MLLQRTALQNTDPSLQRTSGSQRGGGWGDGSNRGRAQEGHVLMSAGRREVVNHGTARLKLTSHCVLTILESKKKRRVRKNTRAAHERI